MFNASKAETHHSKTVYANVCDDGTLKVQIPTLSGFANLNSILLPPSKNV